MKRNIGLLTFLLIANITFSQSNVDSTKRTKEILITTNSLTSGNYGFQFKMKVFNNSYLRLGLAYLYLDYISNTPQTALNYPTTSNNSGFSFIFGLEERKPVNEQFVFTYGLDAIINGTYYKIKTDNPNISESLRETHKFFFTPGLGLNFGTRIKISNNFYFGAEITPQILYSMEDNTNSTSTGNKIETVKASLSTKDVKLLMIYRFN